MKPQSFDRQLALGLLHFVFSLTLLIEFQQVVFQGKLEAFDNTLTCLRLRLTM